MFVEKLSKAVEKNNSRLCVGLDFDPARAGDPFQEAPFEYNRLIIDATRDMVCAYKPNAAFYEALGLAGWEALKKTIEYIPDDIPVILDAKRGDIGNTSRMYASAVFDILKGDAITVSPYMGEDSVSPFLEFPGKGVFVLCLTSNRGSADFQRLKHGDQYFYLHVAQRCNQWDKTYKGSIGLVVGATQDEIAQIRSVSALPFLIPGIGAQGGDLEKAVTQGNKDGGLAVINASRSIIYPKGEGDLSDRIRKAARTLRDDINRILDQMGK
jgi:orotidine-5'-phosphate decarboxylase